MDTCMVLEGGGMRGLYTAGVLDVWMDEGIRPDAMIGVSAGALFGCNLFSHQRGRTLRYNLKYAGDPRYMSIRSLVTTGNIFNRPFAYHELPFRLDPFDEAAFEAYGGEFYAGCCNMATGKSEYLRVTDTVAQMNIFEATSAMPYVSRPVEVDGQWYLDGGVGESVPVAQAMKMGARKIICLLTQPDDYRKKPADPRMAKVFYRKYPKLVETINTRWERYNAETEFARQMEREGRIFLLRPQTKLDVSRTEKNPTKLQAAYDIGAADAKRTIAQLKAYLES